MLKIGFRLNANLFTGLRHLQRCLTLAAGMKESEPSCEIFFLMSHSGDYSSKITNAGFNYVDLGSIDFAYEDTEATVNIIAKNSLDVLVVDSCSIDENYLKTMKEKISLLAVIDDHNRLKNYSAHILVNNNLHAHMVDYVCNEETQLLLGTEFTLLRAEFDQYQDLERNNPEKALRLLIFFGGNDPLDISTKAVKALKSIDEHFKAIIVTGKDFQKGEGLAHEIGIDARFNVVPDDQDMPRRMAWADLTLASPGTIFYESMFMKLPNMLVQQADEQAHVMEYAGMNGLAIPLGNADHLDSATLSKQIELAINDKAGRDRICARTSELVDGLGRFRLAQEIFDMHKDLAQ